MIEVPVGYGELVDKITILRIKTRRISDTARRAHAQTELDLLTGRWEATGLGWPAQTGDLEAVNEELWDVEDQLRRLEAARDFGADFVRLARAVYVTNDRRAAPKRAINEGLGSGLVEVKDYVKY